MKTECILEYRDKSVLVVEERNIKEIVVAVPHHAPLGVEELPSEEHKNADENAGLLGFYTAQLLNCCSVIACNYFIDSNKNESSDYFNRLLTWKPKILVEIHGHGSTSAKYDIEISSGRIERNKWSVKMASRLEEAMAKLNPLQHYTICGDYSAIYFKASKSKTIASDKWIPFHIELPKSLRAQRSQYHPFCELLAEIVLEMLENYCEISACLS
jgi:hypothetical protein